MNTNRPNPGPVDGGGGQRWESSFLLLRISIGQHLLHVVSHDDIFRLTAAKTENSHKRLELCMTRTRTVLTGPCPFGRWPELLLVRLMVPHTYFTNTHTHTYIYIYIYIYIHVFAHKLLCDIQIVYGYGAGYLEKNNRSGIRDVVRTM